jgi:hypothetical protein
MAAAGGGCRLRRSEDMRTVQRARARTVRRGVAAVGLAASLVAIPAVAASAAPSPSPTPTSAVAPPKPPGLSLRLGAIGVNIALPLNLANILVIGSPTVSSPPPTTPPPPTSSNNPPPTTNPPPTSTHNQPPPPTHQPSTSASQSQNGGGFVAPPATTPSVPTRTTPAPTHTSSSAHRNPGTGTIGLSQRLMGNASVVMLAVVLAGTALAVLAFARLGGIRGPRRKSRQH